MTRYGTTIRQNDEKMILLRFDDHYGHAIPLLSISSEALTSRAELKCISHSTAFAFLLLHLSCIIIVDKLHFMDDIWFNSETAIGRRGGGLTILGVAETRKMAIAWNRCIYIISCDRV